MEYFMFLHGLFHLPTCNLQWLSEGWNKGIRATFAAFEICSDTLNAKAYETEKKISDKVEFDTLYGMGHICIICTGQSAETENGGTVETENQRMDTGAFSVRMAG
ncbi:MAG: hypothetical protein IIU04_05515 [Bacteroidales bacterium]|nr:hypothetical protein [Bacteroidales bacterium]